MDTPKEKIVAGCGHLIKARRTRVGISQEELADRCHLDRTYISGIERGVRNPSLTALFALARGFSVSLSELLDGLEAEAAHD